MLIGREGVSKVDGAIVELIKNTYDADADFCFLCIDKAGGTIYLFDNGTGMSSETIINCWMLIGTANKHDEYISKRNRIKSGEKGIGRFALDRLGSLCTMYTKTTEAKNMLRWSSNWADFEDTQKTLDEMQADLEELDVQFKEVIPAPITTDIEEFVEELNTRLIQEGKKPILPFRSGTLFVISGLRDSWDSAYTKDLIAGLGTLLPPTEQSDFYLCTKANMNEKYKEVINPFSEDYDYRIHAEFDGKEFHISCDRNEFDIYKIPSEVFLRDEFRNAPFRKEDFQKRTFSQVLSIEELIKSTNSDLINKIRELGSFSFEYSFLKMSSKEDDNEVFYYKEIGPNRAKWLKEYGGIKIYRDSFFVRPYGDPTADSFDWLGLDARKANNPASVSHPGGGWHVRNRQGYGTVYISRINNGVLLDKSSREGIIENSYFSVFRNVLIEILSVFEKDRAYICRAFKDYKEYVDQESKLKEEGKVLAEELLRSSSEKNKSANESNELKLARTVRIFEKEREDLLSEIQQLKALATSGLLTSTVAHDLKSINAILVSRVDNLRDVIKSNDQEKLERHLSDLTLNDEFLKSWLTIVSAQARKDRRTRRKANVYSTVRNLVETLNPILERKKVCVCINDDGQIVEKKIFKSDFDSILYNLIINSLEAFQEVSRKKRIIEIDLSANNKYIVIDYKDNGPGISDMFSNPYEIFNFGTTSKKDKDGNIIGTGMGMYIVASTLREYNGAYTIKEACEGFEIELKIERGAK